MNVESLFIFANEELERMKLKAVTESGQRHAFINMGVDNSLRYASVWWTLLLY
jgi:hypothetical protein